MEIDEDLSHGSDRQMVPPMNINVISNRDERDENGTFAFPEEKPPTLKNGRQRSNSDQHLSSPVKTSGSNSLESNASMLEKDGITEKGQNVSFTNI